MERNQRMEMKENALKKVIILGRPCRDLQSGDNVKKDCSSYPGTGMYDIGTGRAA